MRLSIQTKIVLVLGLIAGVALMIAVHAVLSANSLGLVVPKIDAAARDALSAERLEGLVSLAVMESRGVYLAQDTPASVASGRKLEEALNRIRAMDVGWVDRAAPRAKVDADKFRADMATFLKIRQGFVEKALAGSSVLVRAEGDNDEARSRRIEWSNQIERLKLELVATAERAVLDADQAITYSKATVTLIAIACVLLALGLSIVLSLHLLAGPIRALTEKMTRLANGEIDVVIEPSHRQDEIGDMERALLVLRDAVKKNNDLLAELRSRDLEEAMLRQQAAVRDRVVSFDHTLRTWISRLAVLISRLTDAASTMTAASLRSRQGTEAISEASRRAASDAAAVAHSAEELSDSVDQIEKRIVDSAALVRQTVERARTTSNTVDELVSFADRVGTIVQVIGEIAGQTNLLALNATIEAARAGEAGRGFAVVAQEVKSLASQTAKATGEIGDQIESIQRSSFASAEALGAIQAKIGEVDANTGAIAVTADQQRTSAKIIASSIRATADHAKDMAQLAESLKVAAQDSAESASTFVAIVRDIDSQALAMGREVEHFFAGLKVG
jgi:methyl-accepting chemotaxis protein